MMALFQHKHPPGMGFHYKDNTVVVSETVLFLKVKASRGLFHTTWLLFASMVLSTLVSVPFHWTVEIIFNFIPYYD